MPFSKVMPYTTIYSIVRDAEKRLLIARQSCYEACFPLILLAQGTIFGIQGPARLSLLNLAQYNNLNWSQLFPTPTKLQILAVDV